MFRSVVGLDVGASAVKAVALKGAIRAVQLGASACVEQAGAPLADSLRALVAQAPLRHDEVVAALPGQRVSTRLLSFPPGTARKLDQVVPFELESQIPFPLDQVVVAYHRLPVAADGGEVQVLAAAAQSSDVAHLLEACAAAGLDPREIDLDAAALATLAQVVPESGGAAAGATGIIDLGATKTGVAIAAGGSLRLVRTILTGGQALTRGLAQALGIPEAEAEALKRELSPVGGADARTVAAVAAASRALEPLVAEIHKTLVAYRQTGGPDVERLLLVGGGASLGGLPEMLTRALDVPSRVVRPAHVPGLGAAALPLGPEYMPAVALALGAFARRDHGRLDFRRGAFAYKRELAGLRRRLTVSAALAAAILILVGVDFYREYKAKEARYAAVQAQVRQAYREILPQGPAPANEALALKSETEKLKKELAQIGSLAGGRLTPLAILAELSQRVPRDVRVDVLELIVERNQVRLRAETDSFEAVDRVKAELLKFDPFTDIQVSDARVNANQTSVGFRFTIALAEEV